jgi:sugar transferase (PEP-CTERM/EpsH1 system associated)
VKVLFVSYGLPYPPDAGARQRDYYLIRHVARVAEVAVCSLLSSREDLLHVLALREFCAAVEVCDSGRQPLLPRLSVGLRGVLRGQPVATQCFFFPELAAKINALVRRHDIHLVQIEHSILAGYRDAVPPGRRPLTVLSFHNVAAQQYRRLTRLAAGPGDWLIRAFKAYLMSGWEGRLAGRFDHCLVVSSAERDLLWAQAPGLAVSIIPNGTDAERPPLPEAEGGNDLLFVGVMDYPPNADGVIHFCRTILPLVHREVPNARLLIVGHSPPEAVRRLAGDDVVVTEGVADVLPYYRQTRVCVVPLRAGAGTRLKILEAMALGRPVVSTTVGCEGLEVGDGDHLHVADEPAAFARQVVRLLRARPLREALAARARRLVEERYAWPVIGDRLLGVYRRLMAQREREGLAGVAGRAARNGTGAWDPE